MTQTVDFVQIFNFVDKIGAIVILSAIVYYGKQVIEDVIKRHNNHTDEMFKKYELLQNEVHLITKEAVKSITKNNAIYPKIEQILKILKNYKLSKESSSEVEKSNSRLKKTVKLNDKNLKIKEEYVNFDSSEENI